MTARTTKWWCSRGGVFVVAAAPSERAAKREAARTILASAGRLVWSEEVTRIASTVTVREATAEDIERWNEIQRQIARAS